MSDHLVVCLQMRFLSEVVEENPTNLQKLKIFPGVSKIKTYKSIPNLSNFTANNRIRQQAMDVKTQKSSSNFKSA